MPISRVLLKRFSFVVWEVGKWSLYIWSTVFPNYCIHGLTSINLMSGLGLHVYFLIKQKWYSIYKCWKWSRDDLVCKQVYQKRNNPKTKYDFSQNYFKLFNHCDKMAKRRRTLGQKLRRRKKRFAHLNWITFLCNFFELLRTWEG